MIRILFVSTSTTLGGAEKTLYSLATLVDPKAFQVAGVVSLKPPGPYARRLAGQGVTTHTLDLRGRASFKTVHALARIIEGHRPDVVHALMYQAIQLSRLAKRRTSVPFKLVSSPRVSYRTRSALTLLIDRLLKGADDLLIAECAASRDYLVKKLGYDARKVQVLYNGVDLAQWPVSKLDRQKKRLELRLAGSDILVGAVGRLDGQKGHSVLIEAVSKLKTRYPVRCVIIGEGPKRAALEAQVRRLALEKHVWLLGERDDVTEWLSSFDLFALPSLWEGLPNALLEAMALGLPVAASAVDGVPELIQDGQNGALVPPRDPVALAKKLAELASDPALRSRLGSAAKITVAERFSLPQMLSAYEAAYRQVITQALTR